MPVLGNARHERFAQAIAEGKTIIQAHELAGYKPDDGNASKLAARPEITARVQEITGKAAKNTGASVEWATKHLMAIVGAAAGDARISDAVRSIDLLARLHGWMAPEKRELTGKDGNPIAMLLDALDGKSKGL